MPPKITVDDSRHSNDNGADAAVVPGECDEKLFRSFVLVDFNKSSLIDSCRVRNG
jgi:hypothetical protein